MGKAPTSLYSPKYQKTLMPLTKITDVAPNEGDLAVAVIHVNFRDREFVSVKNDVIHKLDEWGLNPEKFTVPKDAIACALDEVRLYESYDERNEVLLRLEEQFEKRKEDLP